jgi:4-amino-4-deoxy-L-arabinose transferase-like glycosyltransferase
LKNYLFIFIIALALFFPGLGNVHLFDWDEINFAESAREMLLTEDYSRVQINFKPFWEKPPLFIWIQALSMKVFGVNEYAARFPNAVCGFLTLCIIFFIGKKWHNERIGWYWVIGYACSILPHLYFKSGIIDPFFNLFIFTSLYFIIEVLKSDVSKKRLINSGLAGLCLGLAILTKGPVALLIVLLTVFIYIFIQRFSVKIRPLEIIMTGLFALLITFVWFGFETIKNGFWFLETFITYQIRLFKTEDAGHGGPFFYHWIVLLIGCFPASIFALYHLIKKSSYDKRNIASIFMVILFFTGLILFSIVKTKIVHYSSICYFPLTYLAAIGFSEYLSTDKKNYQSLILKGLLILIGIVLGVVITALTFIEQFKTQLIPLIKDPFAVGNLSAEVQWSGYEWVSGIFIIIGVDLFLIVKDKTYKILSLCIGTLFTIQLTLYLIVPKVERYSQGAAIDFFISKQKENCLVEPRGYKSYAQLFYSQKPLSVDINELVPEKVWSGDVNKKVYFVSKNTLEKDLMMDSNIVMIGHKNGFVFYELKSNSRIIEKGVSR